MAPRWFGRLATAALTASTLVVFVACDAGYYDGYYGRGRNSCEYPVRQCQTYCQDYCDAWGYCYPYCQDQCWTDCADDGASSSSSGGASTDASTGAVDGAAPVADAAAPVSDAGGSICAPCATNVDCQEGALCIFYGIPSTDGGDPDSGAPGTSSSSSASFCGGACSSAVPCPTGFSCATLGARQQCVPSVGRCN